MNDNILKKAINKIVLSKYSVIEEIHKIEYRMWGNKHIIDVYFYVNENFDLDDAVLQEKIDSNVKKLFKDMGFDGDIICWFAETGKNNWAFISTAGYKHI